MRCYIPLTPPVLVREDAATTLSQCVLILMPQGGAWGGARSLPEPKLGESGLQ